MCRFLSFLLLVELYTLEFHPGPRLATIVQVVVTAESPSHWNKQYIPQLKTAIETEWHDQLGHTY